MNRTTLALLALALTGCTPTQMALYGGSYDNAFKLMEGTGTMMQRPDGALGFRYVITTNAYKGLVEGDQEPLRLEALSRWLGNQKVCQKGYNLDKRTDNTVGVAAVIYEGHCK